MDETPELILFLQKYDPDVQRLALRTRDLILTKISGLSEIIDEKANLIAYGFSNTYKQTICTLILSRKTIKLGFYKGIQLTDPEGLLTGTGKVHKYVVIENTLNFEYLSNLLESAMDTYHERKKTI